MRRLPLVLALATLATITSAARGDSIESARSLFLNLSSQLNIKNMEVAAPPAGVTATWAAKIQWQQDPGRQEWGDVGLGLRTDATTGFSFDLLVESASGPAALAVYLSESDDDRWVESWNLAERAGKGWLHVDLKGDALRLWKFGNGKREPQTIGRLVIEPSGKNAKAVFWIANLTVHTQNGPRDVLPLMADADCPPPSSIPQAIRVPATPRCYMGMPLRFYVKPDGQEFVAEVRKLVPNLGMAATESWRPEWREIIERARRDGIDVRLQNAGIAGMEALITRAGAWGVDPQGRSRNTTPGFSNSAHGVSYCHPTTREAVRRVMAAMRGVGMTDYEQIDYVWPWFGGPWGYAPADILAFRTDLAELDEGLRLATGKTVHFWEYLDSYGTAKLRPADLGLDAWDSFHPKPTAKASAEQAARNGFVFTGLIHYEWLKFAQAMGQEANSWGGQFHATMNPEDVANGGDYLYWNRLASTGTAYYERFGNPGEIEAWCHYIPYLRDEARRAGKRLGVIYEVGVGGHGRPYLDPEVAYCMSYDCTACGQFDDMQNEWMGEADWKTSQTGHHRDRLQQWLATARAFNQARRDGAVQPRPKALAIGLRCVLHATGLSPSYQLTSGALLDLNIDCDHADLTMSPDRWNDYQVLIYTPWESSRKHLDALDAWLDAKPGRVLITHGAVPTRIANGLGCAPSAKLGDGQLGDLLGLGTISVGGAASGRIVEKDSQLREVFEGAKELRLPGSLFATTQGKSLVELGGRPLVTGARRPNGSCVFYLNYAAGQPETRETDGKILRRLLLMAGCMPTAVGDAIYCHSYNSGPGKVAVLWSVDACKRFKFEYRDDIEQRMKYKDAAVGVPVQILVQEGTYRVYDYLSGEEEVMEVKGPSLPIALRGRSCALVYFGLDTPEWRAHLAKIRAARVAW